MDKAKWGKISRFRSQNRSHI